MVTSVFWVRWLLAACGGVVLFGLLLALAPDLARAGFSWMVYGEPQTIDRFGAEAARYIGLAHAVMGSLMVGWGLALAWVVTSLVRRGSRLGWNIVAVSLLAWFVPDTAASLAFGYWQNAVLNVGFAALFVAPLGALSGQMGDDPVH